MNRRGFLLGVGACALVGAAAVAADLELSPGHAKPRAKAQQPAARNPVKPAREISGHLDSRFTKASMGWTISVPRTSRTDPPLGIVYCLHGYHNDHRMAFDQIHVPEVAASIGLPVVVAAVDGGLDSYWHRRENGTDAGAMFLREFVPLVRDRVGPLPQAIMGWSMGGYGALLAAERATHRFRAVAPASPALWLAPGDTAPGAFDSPADFYANDVFTGVNRLRSLKVAVFCGTSDPFYDATRHLVGLMRFPHEARFAPGGHDDTYWRSVAPAQLHAIGQRLTARRSA
ncbi:MAG TPA: alpha/beta hydrolase-fold protein [Streptosporangiaceae bacterium]|nr:alpha/beta hydrolase-fold protein [Streptosporangiaceae bacterium]